MELVSGNLENSFTLEAGSSTNLKVTAILNQRFLNTAAK